MQDDGLEDGGYDGLEALLDEDRALQELYCPYYTILTILYLLYCTYYTILTTLCLLYYTYDTVLTILYLLPRGIPYLLHHLDLGVLSPYALQERERSRQREAAIQTIRERKARVVQRAWRAMRAVVAVDPIAAMYLERLEQFSPGSMQRLQHCLICGEEWVSGHGRSSGHMPRAFAFREEYAPYFQEKVRAVW